MEATKTRATFSAKHHTNNAATQYTIRASRKIIGTIWSPCEVWNNSHSDEYQITVNVAPGYTLKSYAPTLDEAIAEFDRLTDGKYNIDTKEIPATPTETPRISTQTAETVNVSVKGENAAERAKYRVSRFGGYKIIVGDREQGKVIAVLMAVNGHNVIEINDESAHIATMGEKPLQMDKPIMQLSDAEVLGLIYGYIEPPQSPETPQTVECTADTPKPRETARKPQNRGICNTRHSGLGVNGYAMLDNASATMEAMNVRQDTLRNTLRPVTYVPRERSTTEAACW